MYDYILQKVKLKIYFVFLMMIKIFERTYVNNLKIFFFLFNFILNYFFFCHVFLNYLFLKMSSASDSYSSPTSPSQATGKHLNKILILQKVISPLKKRASLKEITESSLSSNQEEEENFSDNVKQGNLISKFFLI